MPKRAPFSYRHSRESGNPASRVHAMVESMRVGALMLKSNGSQTLAFWIPAFAGMTEGVGGFCKLFLSEG